MRVLITRAAEDAAPLAHNLEANGFTPVAVPLLERVWEISAVIDATIAHPDVDWLIVTSPVVADILAAAAPSAWPGAKIAAVGPATDRRLRAIGRPAALIPPRHTGAALVAAMPDLEGQTVLYLHADLAPPSTAEALKRKGALVVTVVAYRNTEPDGHQDALRTALPVDATTLMSGSAAQRLAAALDPEDIDELGLVFAIGPTTAGVAEQVGLPVHHVANPHTMNGLLTLLIATRSI